MDYLKDFFVLNSLERGWESTVHTVLNMTLESNNNQELLNLDWVSRHMRIHRNARNDLRGS